MKVKITYFLISLTLTFLTTCAFDSHKFIKCDANPFCKRLRDKHNTTTTPTSFYSVSTLNYEKNKISGTLTHNTPEGTISTSGPLKFQITTFGKGIFRMTIQEDSNHNPLKRYETKDVLRPGVAPIDFQNEQGQDEYGNKLLISKVGEPFSVELVNGKLGKSSLIFNGNQLLNIENPTINVPNVTHDSAISADFTFLDSDDVYGIPERAVDLSLPPTIDENGVKKEPYRLYNLDVHKYELNNPIGVYGSIPFLMSITQEQSAGILFLNPSETFVDIKKESKGILSYWISETGLMDIYFFAGPTPKDVISQYTYLTGYTPIPQRFSIAYHQCRWNYRDENDVLTVDRNFDKYNIPYDVIWLDIEHTDEKRYFTWDALHFPDPIRMQNKIARKGRKMVTIVDPHIKRASGYYIHEEATSKGYYIKNAEANNDYEGHCWPGSSSWLDLFNPVVREWYSQQFAYDKYKGSTPNLYTWIDMNEPSVFSGPEVTMHKEAKHFNGLEHRQLHNQYGFYQAMGVFNGLYLRNNGQDRPFILSRSFFPGSQRYTSVWTGDNEAKWDHLDKANPMLMTLGISGITHVGADVGGFFDNPSEELLVRWYQAGAFYPFFRAHAEIQTKRREPWLFGENNMNLIREAIRRRYTLLPYYYTLFFEASYTGYPVLRPLWMEFPKVQRTFKVQDQFLIGESLLVKPVVQEKVTSISVYLPSSMDTIWYDYESGISFKNLGSDIVVNARENKIPVLQRGGSIIPTKQRMRRSSSQMQDDPYTLQVALDFQEQATGLLYEDDGKSYDYKSGKYVLRRFKYQRLSENNHEISSADENVTSSEIAKKDPNYSINNTVELIKVLGLSKKPKKAVLSVKLENEFSDQTLVDLSFDFDDKKSVLKIRNPKCQVDKDWKINLKF